MLQITDMKGEICSLVVSDIWTVFRLVTISFILFHYFSQIYHSWGYCFNPIEMFLKKSFLKMRMKLYYFLQMYLWKFLKYQSWCHL